MDAEQAEFRTLQSEVAALRPTPGEDTARIQYVALLRTGGTGEDLPLGCLGPPADFSRATNVGGNSCSVLGPE